MATNRLFREHLMTALLSFGERRLFTASAAASHLGVTERTVYRYIGELRRRGHRIASESGVGYMLKGEVPVEPTTHIIVAVLEWGRARKAVIEASIYPIGNVEYREALNRLSEAEDKLARLIEGQ